MVNFNRVTLFRDNKIEIIKDRRDDENNINFGNLNLKKENKHLRMITIADLIKVLEAIETTSIAFHHKHGLPTSLKPDAIISLCFPKPIVRESKLIFFQFPPVKDPGHTKVKGPYDFPQYCSNYPAGISMIMSIDEMELADNYLSKPDKQVKAVNLEELKTVKPRKEHNFCQLCLSHFTNYDEVRYRLSNL
jgi:hypothetical protein